MIKLLAFRSHVLNDKHHYPKNDETHRDFPAQITFAPLPQSTTENPELAV